MESFVVAIIVSISYGPGLVCIIFKCSIFIKLGWSLDIKGHVQYF